jgi:hypothetical protein
MKTLRSSSAHGLMSGKSYIKDTMHQADYCKERTMHTKGPWTVEWDEYGGYDCMRGAYEIKDTNGVTVAVLDDESRKITSDMYMYSDEYVPPQELTSRAHLIAAAPELLEALEEIRSHIDVDGKLDKQMPHEQWYQ